jgi:4-amino-4-deoxy-L-arabinose transferase-like glycosyltransferase
LFMNKSQSISNLLSSDIGILILLALARILLQVFTNGQYGFHQDELVTMDIASRHLAWGYVAWPPVTPFLARLSLALFGPSLIGLRSFAVLAEGLVMLLTGLMIRDLGGSRWAQILGAVAVATTPNSIIQGGLFQYETLDYFCWVLLAFTVVRRVGLPDAGGGRRSVVGRTPHSHGWPAGGRASGAGPPGAS